MSLCLIKPAQDMGWVKCGAQRSECSEGRGSSVCLPQRQEVQRAGRKMSASTDLETAYPFSTAGRLLSK